MRRRLLLLLTALACLAVAALPALAADPAEGTVSGATPTVTWAGEILGDISGATTFAISQAGTTGPTCVSGDYCDTFTLTVADAGKNLNVAVKGDDETWVLLEVIAPDDSVSMFYDETDSAKVDIANPAAGEYTVHVVVSPPGPAPIGSYKGTATLTGATATATATATASATATATAEPTATATATPEPTSTPAPQAPPAAPAAAEPARTLALAADRRRLRRAIKGGFRGRTVCTGGCQSVVVRALLPAAAAKRLKLKSSVLATTRLTAAEGRRTFLMRFTPAVRRRLARMKRVDLAVEAVVTDADGRRRTAIDRLTLKR